MSASVYCTTVSGDMSGRDGTCCAHYMFSGFSLFLNACASCEFSIFVGLVLLGFLSVLVVSVSA